MATSDYVIELRQAKKFFPLRPKIFRRSGRDDYLKAVNGVSFKLKQGESLGLAGESGCGKTTTGKILLKLCAMTGGSYFFKGRNITTLTAKEEIKSFRKQAQLIFQNPYDALNPRFTIYRSLLEPLIIHNLGTHQERRDMIRAVMERVNLKPAETFFEKYPHQMSGGQLQRVVLARALIVDPAFIVADEPVSMLDVSVRAGVLNLMKEITEKMDLTTVYISHDLSLIQYMCDYTAIMYLGKIVEWGPSRELIVAPIHPYTKALISAVPIPDPDVVNEAVNISNNVPSPINLPPGCIFQDRCPVVTQLCRQEEPVFSEVAAGHCVACHQAET